MKSDAIPLLRCSTCHGRSSDLTLVDGEREGEEIVSGALVCPRGHRFPIERGIPDFVSDREAVGNDSPVYDTMWRMHEEQQYRGRVAEYEAKFQRFAKLPGRLADYIEGKLVLDGGCGEGRFTYLASALGARHVLALDYSRYALERARMQAGNPANCTFIRASILNPPLAPQVFDLVFSMGVVHHTPDSEKSYQAIRASLKTGGYLAIYVYRLLSLPLAVWPLRLIRRARAAAVRVLRLALRPRGEADDPHRSLRALARTLGCSRVVTRLVRGSVDAVLARAHARGGRAVVRANPDGGPELDPSRQRQRTGHRPVAGELSARIQADGPVWSALAI
jgi:SAM-dependent methyltransferase/uncharacterized protein YbaR (Trm112 family)